MIEERKERKRREEEGRLFLFQNGAYEHCFGEGLYRRIINKDLQNYGEDVRYYKDLHAYISVDEKEKVKNSSYWALKTSTIGGVVGLGPRVFVSNRQQNTHWLMYRTNRFNGEIVFAECYLLEKKTTRQEVVKETGKSLDTIYEWSNKLREATANTRSLSLSKKSDITLFCNRMAKEEFVEIHFSEAFMQRVCIKHFAVKKGGIIEERG